MPRVANPPRGNGESSSGASKQAAVTHARPSSVKYSQRPLPPMGNALTSILCRIPLNDDAREKAVRLQSRQALHDLQMNQLKAAASPRRRLNPHERATSTSPKTPRSAAAGRGKENDHGLAVVGGSALTPMKRVPILANFEEWMKMATDNKINAANSWNFALIDYFHDMTLLKEGDGVNFQKASCTLDGCVKIYTSRVDSVATETGKLLSGLADSGNKKRRGEEDRGNGDGSEDEEEGEEDPRKRGKKRAQRSSEATLAPSFSALQLKKFELEFSVDPLFKKASADFDEGGAKGLLLNHLSIDAQGRIVFDSSDDVEDGNEKTEQERQSSSGNGQVTEAGGKGSETREGEEGGGAGVDEGEDAEIDIASLGAKFFPELNSLDTQDICPSLKNFYLGDLAGSLDMPFLKAPEDWRQERNRTIEIADQSGIFLDGENLLGFEDDDDGALGGFDLPPETGFGEGGEAWARGADIESHDRFVCDNNIENEGGTGGEEGQNIGAFDVKGDGYVVSLNQGTDGGGHENILSYFDQALQKNWAGPEHWRIRRIKDVTKSSTPAIRTRKEKEQFEIDFSSPLNPALAEAIYTPAPTLSSISLPKTQWKSKTRNLLPDDKHFNSRQLLRLFLKPKARIGSRRRGFGSARPQQSQAHDGDELDGEMDEAFWSRKEDPAGTGIQEGDGIQGNYDANFFHDDGAFPGGVDDDDDEFADAREHFSPALEEGGISGPAGIADVLAAENQAGAFGDQLVTQSRRLRPEYVQYARVAKKVDVRRLKEEMWKGMGIGDDPPPLQTASGHQPAPVPKSVDGSLKFTSVISSLQSVYPTQAMADISTSYCFICLLHLANEKGLVIEDVEGLTELNIKVDPSAEIAEGAGW